MASSQNDRKKLTLRHLLRGRPALYFVFIIVFVIAISLAFGLRSVVKPVNPAANGISGVTEVTAISLPWVQTEVLQLQNQITLPRQYTGVIRAARTSELGFKRTGQLQKVYFEQGDRVEAGEVLAELDIEVLLASKKEIAAQLRGAEALLNELRTGPRKQTIQAARTDVGDLEAQLAQAQIDLDRFARLQSSGAVSQQEFEEVSLRVKSIAERLDGAKQRLEELTEGTRLEQIEAQRSEVNRLQAALARIDVDLEESRLLAPYDAVISQRLFDEGSIINMGSPVFRIVEQDRLEAWIGLPVEIAKNLNATESLLFSVNGDQVYGQLIRVLPELDPLTRTQTVRFRLLNHSPDGTGAMDSEDLEFGKVDGVEREANRIFSGSLIPGQLIRVNLYQTIQQTGYWIPMKALARGRRGLWTAYVVTSVCPEAPPGLNTFQSSNDSHPKLEEKVIPRDVEILHIDSDRVFVRGALNEGERVIVNGLHRISPGQRVRVVQAN